MKRWMAILVIFSMLEVLAGCQPTGSTQPTTPASLGQANTPVPTPLKSLSVINPTPSVAPTATPSGESVHIPRNKLGAIPWVYVNGLSMREERENKKVGSTQVEVSYAVLDGLRDQTVEEGINTWMRSKVDELAAAPLRFGRNLSKMVTQEGVKPERGTMPTPEYRGITCGQYLNILNLCSYNIWCSYQEQGYGGSDCITANFDLTDGSPVALKDLFREGIDYKALLNQLVMEDMGRNYQSEEDILCAPFRGIADDQAFFLSDNSLTIVFGPRHSEFIQSPYTVHIPFTEIMPALTLFEKYGFSEKPLYKKEKLIKYLLPNPIWVKHNLQQEYNEDGSIRVVQQTCSFEDMPNETLMQQLNELCKPLPQEEVAKWTGRYNVHNSSLCFNGAGYLCIEIYDNRNKGKDKQSFTSTYHTYDLFTGKELDLKDIFVEGFDYQTVLAEAVEQQMEQKPGIGFDARKFVEDASFILVDSGILLMQQENQYGIDYTDLGQENLVFFVKN